MAQAFPQPAQNTDNLSGILWMLFSMATFAAGDVGIKLLAGVMPPGQIMGSLGLLGTALFAAWTKARGLTVLPPALLHPAVAMRYISEIVAGCGMVLALTLTPLSLVTAILQAAPLVVAMGAALVFGERVGWRRWSAIAVGFCGVLLIVRPGSEGFNSFSLLALVAVLFVVLRDISTRRLNAQIPSIFVSLLTSVAVTVLAAVMAPTMEWRPLSGHALALLGTAAVCVIFGYIFSVKAMRVGEIAFVAPFRYTIMIWAILLGIFVFNDYPSQWTLIGAAIIVGTGVYSFYRERKRRILAAKVAPRNP